MAQAKGNRQTGKKSVEDNFDEMLKVFEGDTDLQGQICESSTSFESGKYLCNDCEAMCKSNGELQRHTLSQHTEDESFVGAMVQLQELTEKAKQLLIETSFYPAKYIKELENFNVMQDLECIKKLGSNLKLCKKTSIESFNADGYNLIVLNSSLIFPGLTPKVATLLSSKSLDVYLAWKNEKKDVYSTYTKNSDDRELSGLQYIAGYVLQKLNQKIRNLKNYDSIESQQTLSILQATKSSDNPNAKLVNASNRGGLWVISNDAEKLFILFEKYFCVQTANTDLHKTDLNMIIKNLLSFIRIFFPQLS